MFDLDVLYYLCGFLCLVQMPIILYWRWYCYIEEETFLENLGFYVMCAFDPVFPFLVILGLTGWCRHVGYSVTSICNFIVDFAVILNLSAWTCVFHEKNCLKNVCFLYVATVATFGVA